MRWLGQETCLGISTGQGLQCLDGICAGHGGLLQGCNMQAFFFCIINPRHVTSSRRTRPTSDVFLRPVKQCFVALVSQAEPLPVKSHYAVVGGAMISLCRTSLCRLVQDISLCSLKSLVGASHRSCSSHSRSQGHCVDNEHQCLVLGQNSHCILQLRRRSQL